MGLLFYPRGGSAHVARNLAATLPRAGWDGTILSGSVHAPGDAASLYRGPGNRPGGGHGGSSARGPHPRRADMPPALAAPAPMPADPPLHPSYEDRADAPD